MWRHETSAATGSIEELTRIVRAAIDICAASTQNAPGVLYGSFEPPT